MPSDVARRRSLKYACMMGRVVTLRRLLLPANHLRTTGGKAIAGMLLSNEALCCLDVSNNHLGAIGIEAVATAIAKNR